MGVADEGVDPLEAYMAHMGDHMDKGRRLHLKQQLQSLYKVRPSVQSDGQLNLQLFEDLLQISAGTREVEDVD